jgi:N,N-dimethylformamidase
MSTPAKDRDTLLIGYADRAGAAPGDVISFMVSCSADRFDAQLVRLIHGDPNKKGPGFQEEMISNQVNRTYPGRFQPIHCGSYGKIPDRPSLRVGRGMTLQAWVYPTMPGKGLQGILTKWSRAEDGSYGLFLDQRGCLAFALATSGRSTEWIHTERPLRAECWHFVAATFDASSGRAGLYQRQLRNWSADPYDPVVERNLAAQDIRECEVGVYFAAFTERLTPQPMVSGYFNGKIDAPKLFNRALSARELSELRADLEPSSFSGSVVGWWDFSQGISGKQIVDRSSQQHHGTLINMPARAVTGHNWNGEMFTSFVNHPGTYGAIHFHDDDLEDAGWEESFAFRVPIDLKSGIYGIRLQTEGAEFYIPFIVKPKKSGTHAKVVFLAPTLTWQAYTNFNEIANEFNLESTESSPWLPEDQFIAGHPELGPSLYDHHSDGSTPFYSSRLRPNLSGGPKYKYAALDSPHLLAADLYIIDWLDKKGVKYDVITDEDLHFEGAAGVGGYRVLITGPHPEYWTLSMLDGLEGFLNAGGNLMYLGGNGLYWVTSIHAESPVIEVRRSMGTGLTRAPEGELFHSTTGELGGIWRVRGRAPQKLLGVGFSAQGGAPGSAYRREPDSFNPLAAFIFEGVGKDELIGNFGLSTGAAAGFEIDRLDYILGTPPQTLLLASSEPHHDSYWHVVEEISIPGIHECGAKSKKVQAHLAYYEHSGGGAVFSVGSIAWAGSLSHNQYANNVSRITENVLRKFASDR